MNIVALPERRMNVAEFLKWAETHPSDEKLELVDGIIVRKYGSATGMVGDTIQHNRIKGAAYRALGDAIAAAGLPCEVFVDGVGVRIEDDSIRIPDVLVQCRADTQDELAVVSDDPLIVVEVISRSSERGDTGSKLVEYLAVPSIRHYLIVNPDKKLVIHHRRSDEAEAIHTSILRAGVVALDPPGITLPIETLFGAR